MFAIFMVTESAASSMPVVEEPGPRLALMDCGGRTTMTMDATPPLMQVKARVRAGHAQLRAMLDQLERMLAQQPGPEEQSATSELTDAIWKLFLVLDDHLGMEERDLLPYLRAAGGPPAVEHLQQEHHEQRTVLLAMVNECDAVSKSTANILDDARWLIGSLRADMDKEDYEFERVAPGTFLSEDGFVADQSSG
jgi:hemerythrin-like domain-containing protein